MGEERVAAERRTKREADEQQERQSEQEKIDRFRTNFPYYVRVPSGEIRTFNTWGTLRVGGYKYTLSQDQCDGSLILTSISPSIGSPSEPLTYRARNAESGF